MGKPCANNFFYGVLKQQCFQSPLVGSTSDCLFTHLLALFPFVLWFSRLLIWHVVFSSIAFFPLLTLWLLNWRLCIFPLFWVILWSFLWFKFLILLCDSCSSHISDLNQTSAPSALAAWQNFITQPANCSPWQSGMSLQFSFPISPLNTVSYNALSQLSIVISFTPS